MRGRALEGPQREAGVAPQAGLTGASQPGKLVAPDARDLLSVAPHPQVGHAIDHTQAIGGVVVALAVLCLVLQRLRALRAAARRAQGPLLLAAASTALAALVWLSWVIATGLTADDKVVISGNQKAIPGEKVAPQDTAITAEAGPPPAGKS